MYCVSQICISDGLIPSRICFSGVMIKSNAEVLDFSKKIIKCYVRIAHMEISV
jgi:hypothetical protein